MPKVTETPQEAKMLTTEQLAIRLRRKPATIHQWRRRHDDAPKPAFEAGRVILWHLEPWQAWLEKRETEQAEAAQNAIRTRKTRDMPRDAHGTRNGYVNYGCRCKRCREANTRYHRERRGGAK